MIVKKNLNAHLTAADDDGHVKFTVNCSTVTVTSRSRVTVTRSSQSSARLSILITLMWIQACGIFIVIMMVSLLCLLAFAIITPVIHRLVLT